MSRIDAALEVYRLEKGSLPDALGELVDAGLLAPDDLRYPWRDEYYYRRTRRRRVRAAAPAAVAINLPPTRPKYFGYGACFYETKISHLRRGSSWGSVSCSSSRSSAPTLR